MRRPLPLPLLLALAVSGRAQPVFIVAGQSNALNWHADAKLLLRDPADAGIAFFYQTGAPPLKGGPAPFNATSDGRWTMLGPQTQEPYRAYCRAFFGPEITLARCVAAAGSVAPAVIKVAYFGTNLAEDWNPDAAEGNRLYARMREQVRIALGERNRAGRDTRIVGFFWMQGETDAARRASAEAYGGNLEQFIARVRADFSDRGHVLPFVMGRIGPPPPKGYPFQAEVRAAQVAVAARTAAVAWVDTDDLPRDHDGIHLLAPGVMTLGARWADAWAKLSRAAKGAGRRRGL